MEQNSSQCEPDAAGVTATKNQTVHRVTYNHVVLALIVVAFIFLVLSRAGVF